MSSNTTWNAASRTSAMTSEPLLVQGPRQLMRRRATRIARPWAGAMIHVYTETGEGMRLSRSAWRQIQPLFAAGTTVEFDYHGRHRSGVVDTIGEGPQGAFLTVRHA